MPNHNDHTTWCPSCREMVATKTKPYMLAGEKRRDDYFCALCNYKVILHSTDDQSYTEVDRREWIDRSGIKHFGRELLSQAVLIFTSMLIGITIAVFYFK